MTGILISESLSADAMAQLQAAAHAGGNALEVIALPADPDARVSELDVLRIEIAFYSGDIFKQSRSRAFFAAVRKAPNLKWLHVFNAGVDHPIFTEMLDRGVRLTTSAGTTAVPIAQTAITGLLMLARGFPHWLDAQRRRSWEPQRGSHEPDDLAGQTLCVLGLGAIGAEIARLAQALGMHVIGVRRSPRRADDPVAQIHPPTALADVLPRCRWLAIACPLTPETRRMIDAAALARLPRGARVLNVARGEIVDEAALTEALRSGHLAGAYLDVFEKEPLAGDSPLWDLPNVIVTPHNSGTSAGSEARVFAVLLRNLEQWARGLPLVNEVRRPG
jgi:phosphoglycerate dehydrogenase-like enzyme